MWQSEEDNLDEFEITGIYLVGESIKYGVSSDDDIFKQKYCIEMKNGSKFIFSIRKNYQEYLQNQEGRLMNNYSNTNSKPKKQYQSTVNYKPQIQNQIIYGNNSNPPNQCINYKPKIRNSDLLNNSSYTAIQNFNNATPYFFPRENNPQIYAQEKYPQICAEENDPQIHVEENYPQIKAQQNSQQRWKAVLSEPKAVSVSKTISNSKADEESWLKKNGQKFIEYLEVGKEVALKWARENFTLDNFFQLLKYLVKQGVLIVVGSTIAGLV